MQKIYIRNNGPVKNFEMEVEKFNLLIGEQATGKSTIAEAMAKRYNTNFMFEYGRYHWDVYQKDRIETLEQIEEITERHIAMEEKRLETANK